MQWKHGGGLGRFKIHVTGFTWKVLRKVILRVWTKEHRAKTSELKNKLIKQITKEDAAQTTRTHLHTVSFMAAFQNGRLSILGAARDLAIFSTFSKGMRQCTNISK